MATVAAEPDDSPAAGILGGAKSLAAFLQYLGLNSLDELEPIGSDEVQMQLDLREAA